MLPPLTIIKSAGTFAHEQPHKGKYDEVVAWLLQPGGTALLSLQIQAVGHVQTLVDTRPERWIYLFLVRRQRDQGF